MDGYCGHPLDPLGLCGPYGVAVDGNENVYVADNGHDRVLKRSPDGNITIFATALFGPHGISIDGLGNLYVADTYNNRIVKILPDGTVTTIAGRGPSYSYYYKGGYSGDGGWATDAELYLPHAVAVDAAGNVYIADSENFRVRKVTPDGIITTVAGNGTWGTF
jgi:sugar lactone lactonase YvrE